MGDPIVPVFFPIIPGIDAFKSLWQFLDKLSSRSLLLISSTMVLWNHLTTFIAAVLKLLVFSAWFSAPRPQKETGHIIWTFKTLNSPSRYLIISSFFISVYNWRTFFLIYQ
jgi:uncharacterized membrane protein YjjB (DUF3815 family)